MLLKECARCHKLISYGLTYCSTCAPIVEAEQAERKARNAKESNKRYNAKRDPKYTRFYHSTEWRQLSRSYLQRKEYKCEDCNRLATEVHHIIAIQNAQGWEHRLDEGNLAALCVRCHNARHDKFRRSKQR